MDAMKKKLKIWTTIVAALTAIAGIFSSYFLGNDNLIEELAESVVESVLCDEGINLDFSPENHQEMHKKILEQIDKSAKQELPKETKSIILNKVEKKLKDELGG